MAGYGDDAGFTTWLAENGYTLPADAPAPAVLRQRGSVYIDGLYGTRFTGEKTGGWAQERAWPRTGAYAGGSAIPDDVVPLPIIHAAYEAAVVEALNPGSLTVTGSEATRVKRERVEGAVEVEYQAASSTSAGAAAFIPIITVVDGLVAPFLRPVVGFPAILVV